MSSKKTQRRPPATAAVTVDWSHPEALHKFWSRAHLTDREPWPDESLLKRLAERHGPFAAWLSAQEHPRAAAHALQDAWRHFHAGDFDKAIAAARDLGPLGAVVAGKAAAVDSLHSRHTPATVLKMLETAAAEGERAVQLLEDHANIHYTLALALGRYSQRISIINALAKGLGGRIRNHLDRVIELEPQHAEAHLALGLYHAEILGKLGSIAASMAYGASRSAATGHFQHAMKIAPHSPIVLMEYAHGLQLLDQDTQPQKLRPLYEQAAACKPLDIMESLYVAQAHEALE